MSLAEKIVGVKAKKFLTDSLYNMAIKISKIMNDWQSSVEDLIYTSMLENFGSSDKIASEKEIKNFLQWLGFTPVRFEFLNDVKLGKIYLGTSRLWKNDPKENEVMRIVLEAIIAGVTSGYYSRKPRVTMITGKQLPPRYTIYFQTSEEFGMVGTAETVTSRSGDSSTMSVIGNSLVEPFIGRGLDSDEILSLLLSSAKEVLIKEYPGDKDNYEEDFEDVPVRSILYSYQKSAEDNRIDEISVKIGEAFTKRVLEKNPDIPPEKAIKGLGFLPADQITDLMFYGNDMLCQRSKKVGFCEFLSKIWEVYFTKILGSKYVSTTPLCAKGSSKLCLYSFNKE
ncbi:MAG: hypothetical protein ACTSP4_08770 [Candidatus Hodarchaeales archaeon]